MFYRVRNFFIILILIVAAFIVQYTIIARIPVLGCAPNLLLILTFMYGYSRGKTAGMLVGFFAGLVADVFFCEVLGFHALIFLLIGYVNGRWNKYFYSNVIYIPLILLLCSDAFYSFAYYICWYVLRGRLAIGYCLTHIILPELLMTFVAGLLLFKPLKFLNSKMYMYYDNEESEE